MITTSRFALAAAAGLIVGGIALTDARAADLGGDCCADLEERVAELEATTARKGNKKVSLEVSGHVNRALLVWDDGEDSDAYIVDNAYSSSRFRFRGSAQMKPGWKAGFLIEIQTNDSASNNVDNFLNFDEGNGETALSTRHVSVYVESERLGRVTIGQTSPATDDIILISTADTGAFATMDVLYNTGFLAIGSGTTWGVLTGNWGFVNLDTNRGDFVRYDTPAIYGFIFSAAWGENDVWDIGVRYAKEWNSFKIAAGVGYYWNGDRHDPGGFVFADGVDVEEWKGSGSIMHMPTGLYVYAGFNSRHTSDIDTDFDDDSFDSLAWFVQAGIQKKWLSYGPTVLFGEYGNYEDFGEGASFRSGATFSNITGSNVDRWGVGIAQTFDSAATQIYATYQHYEADVDCFDADGGCSGDVDDMNLGVIGARIQF